MIDKAPKQFGFSAKERLKSKKKIEELFKNGSSFFTHPFLVKYLPATGSDCNQIVITVPKKYVRSAVMRNRIKRRIREAYRLNKHLHPGTNHFFIAFLYLSKEDIGHKKTNDKLKLILSRLSSTPQKEKTQI